MLSFFKIGKTHVPHAKNTADMPPVRMAPPKEVLIPTVQHIGAPATLTVKAGDRVFVGTLIAEAGGRVSAPIHSSVSGTVKGVENYLLPNGRVCPAVRIESDGEMAPDPALCPPRVESFADLAEAARAAGLVGLGGAGFPTSIKLDPAKRGELDTLIVNAAECEPYITSDTRTMLDEAERVREGVELLLSLSGIASAVIGIERNKPKCIAAMRKTFEGDARVRVEALPATYPQGGEKILIYNVTGRVVPEGKLPSDVGVLLMNVTTVAFLARYVETGMPLVEKCVTVDGSAVKEPKNLIAPVGTAAAELLAACGTETESVGKLLFGGPMMGSAACDASAPVMKNTNALIALAERDARLPKTTPCIHCGRCVAACPMSLNPTVFAKSMGISDKAERAARLEAAHVALCIECGSCSYVCPAKRPLVENNRLSKAFLREMNAEKAKTEGRGK